MEMSERLAAYLQERVPAARDVTVTGLQRKSGGASRETWAFAAHWTEGDTARSGEFILRRDPTASLLESDRSRELAVLRTAHAHGIPVPRPHWLEIDGRWLDRPFFIMDRVPGVAPVGTFPGGYPPDVQERVTAQFADIRESIRALVTAQIARDEEWVSIFPGSWG